MPWTENDYKSRKYAPEVEFLYEAEEEVLNFQKENVKCYVVAAGVIYGIEEQLLREHFKCAWLQSPPALQYVGEGDNLVPCIHVRDLARFIKKIIEVKPENRYIFAVDSAPDTRSKSLIEGISKGMGSGEVEFNEPLDKTPMFTLVPTNYNEVRVEQANWTTMLQAYVNVKPSSLIIRETEEGVDEEMEFEWHCKEGLTGNIKKVAQEYCDVNNLKPIKIYINGPPLSGKTTIVKELAKKYNIIHVTLKDVIDLLKGLPEDDWLKEELDEFIKEHPGEDYPTLILCEGYKRVLRANACVYRGYVLDGFPRSYSEAKGLFYTNPRKPKKKPEVKKDENGEEQEAQEEQEVQEEGEEEEEQVKKVKFEGDIYPHSFIMLNSSNEFLNERYEELGQKPLLEKFQRELEMYNMLNMIETCSLEEFGLTVWNFFQERKDEVITKDIRADTDYVELLESFRLYIERKGRPYNFLDPEENLLSEREQSLIRKEQTFREEEFKRITEVEKLEEKKKSEQYKKNRAKWPEIERHVEEVKAAQQFSARYSSQ
jgi:adenylate kinase